MFLLDIRYVYTEVSDMNIRAFALFLVLGVVALNRLIGRDGTEESLAYFVLLAVVTGFYTFVTTGAYEVGSIAGKFMNQPERDQIPETIKEQLIVELYSK